MSLVTNLFEIRSRSDFGANDITLWVIKAFEELYDISPSREVQTEVYIREENVKGRADVVVQESIGIETKSNLPDELEKAEEQVQNILTKLERESGGSPVGIATDGERWRFYVLVNDEPFEYFSFQIEKDPNEDVLQESLWKGLTPLRREKNRPHPTAEAVSEVFRPHGPAFNEIKSHLETNVEYIVNENDVRFTSKFGPWFELFSYVYNDFEDRCQSLATEAPSYENTIESLKEKDKYNDLTEETLTGGIELYMRHTYLALIAKTLSALVALGEDEVTSTRLENPERIITGEIVRSNGVTISDPNDFFTWIRGGQDLEKVISSIIKPLQRFSDDYTDDVFRHLYENVVDEETRHELGEFFTPKWIAQMMINDVVSNHSETVLDPACGSGTFLVFAFNRKLELLRDKEDEVTRENISQLLEQTWGVDVNPLSVILARTNIYLSMVSNLKSTEYPREINPRIYNADTFIFPRYSEKQRQLSKDSGSPPSIVPVPVSPHITVPVLPRLHPDEAIEYIGQMGELMEDGVSEVPDSVKEDGDIGEYQESLLRTMHDLKNEYGDSLWKFVMRNYGVPPLLKNEFDVVVGNPPWLSYREAEANLKDTMEKIAIDYSIKPPVQAKTSFNLSIPFFLTSANFVDIGGNISFVFPLSVLNSPAHTPFMNMLINDKSFELDGAYDLEDIAPYPFPHGLPSAILSVGIEEAAE